ncbi:MAG: HRDC domain-containing protein, partial [Saprospiraceae bacterium]
KKLKALSNPEHHIKAKITGEFPEHSFPTKEILSFKIGAQVLFIKNDRSPKKRYFNGKIGRITAIEKNHIYIKCPNEEETIEVSPTEWKNVKYELDKTTKEITEEEKGVFTQYPLKLAWAITIHKSQGLTFEKAIIDAQAAFAHGQVYVALSRCKSFEGIVLRSPINYGSVKTDGLVKDYSAKAEKNAPDKAHLLSAKKQYQQDLIEELFNFKDLRLTLNDLLEISLAYQPKFNAPLFPKVADWETQADTFLFSMAAKFAPKLRDYFAEPILPVANAVLMARLKKAGQYFSNNLKENLAPALQNIPILVDNQEIKSKAVNTLDLLKKQVFIKAYCFKALIENGFDAQQYLKNKAIAATDFEKTKPTKKTKSDLHIPKEVPHPLLYKQLYYWRNAQAAMLKRQAHEVISTMSMIDMTKKLPTNKATLLQVKGFGLVKFKVFGKLIMEVIDDYCYQHQLAANILVASPDLNSKTGNAATNTAGATKTYSVDNIRVTHPKAYAPWTEAEEKELVQLKASEKSISYIAGVLGRKRGAITSRLKKLDGETTQGVVVFS